MQQSHDVRREWEGLHRAIRRLLELHEAFGASASSVAAEVSAWTPNQHLYHIALATDMGLRSAMSIVKGTSPLIEQNGEPTELAREVFGNRSYPRGKSQSPRMVQPPEDVDPAFVATELTNALEAVERIEDQLETIPQAEGRIQHPLLGALSAPEWMLFVNLHAAHHVAILEDIEAALGLAH